MTSSLNYSLSFQLERVLPFIKLAEGSSIQVGPILFSPVSFVLLEKEEDQKIFHSYLQHIDLMTSEAFQQQLQQMTSLSIHSDFSWLSEKMKKSLITDALYLLYFASYFRHLYEEEEVPSFNPFRKMVSASLRFIQNKKNWEHLSIQTVDQEEVVQIHALDPEICQGLGKILEGIYQSPATAPSSLIQIYKRFMRAIRYLVDRLFHRFINLFDRESLFSGGAFEAEEIIFLASSFETLFDISDRHPSADFKHKVRPLLHLKYGSPIEMFWKWVDDFYALKQAVIKGETLSDTFFRLNPNFEISHLLLGTKLFIYSIYYTLFRYQLLPSTQSDLSISSDFKGICPEEVLLFFWTEDSLLHKLNLFIKEVRKAPENELYADIHLLTHLYVFLYQRYYFGERKQFGARFIPSPAENLKEEAQEILDQLKQEKLENPQTQVRKFIDPLFLEILEKRLFI